jgi:hypothetical protein
VVHLGIALGVGATVFEVAQAGRVVLLGRLVHLQSRALFLE